MGITPSVWSLDRRLDWHPTALRLGGLLAVLVGISLWASVVAIATQSVGRWAGVTLPLVVVAGLTSIAGLVLGSMVYARARGVELSLGLPARESWTDAVAVLVASGTLAVVASLVGNAVFAVPLSAMVQQWLSPEVSLAFVLRVTLPIAVLVGIGHAFLLCGLVSERVRGVVDDADAVTVAAVLVGFFWLLPVEAQGGVRLSPGGLFELLVSLVFGVAFGMGLGILYRDPGDGSLGTLDRRELIVVAVAVLGVVGLATELVELPRAVGDLLWIAVLWIGILGYERTRSVWVAAGAITTFQLIVFAVVAVEAAMGLAPGP